MADWIQTNAALRKYDLADRDQNNVKARVNWTGIPAPTRGWAELVYPNLAADATDPGAFHLTGTNLLSGSTAIFLQGDAVVPGGTGASFGAGVRCVAGQMLRLYVRTISGGSASAPGAGDRSISNRSADLGASIPPGSTRNYQVYYRDPGQTNPGPPCPANATFNISRGLQAIWN